MARWGPDVGIHALAAGYFTLILEQAGDSPTNVAILLEEEANLSKPQKREEQTLQMNCLHSYL